MESFRVQVQTTKQYQQRSNDPILDDHVVSWHRHILCDVPIDHYQLMTFNYKFSIKYKQIIII